MNTSIALRQPCPPGACICEREQLLDTPGADLRILNLTRQEEKRLLERLENLKDLADLEHMQRRIYQQLGVRVEITPSDNEVRSMRGITIALAEHPGLCRKTRQSIPAAIRRAMENRPEIAYRLLDAQDLLRDT
ncbi:hypothetical protein DMX09_27735 [Pseudomonas protegens]|uniref:Ribosomal protein S3AE n=1 Tax=Pseudomonas protegens TaxID=380021 RepID=A0A9Q6IAR0_9PSED|nr:MULTISPECIES: hypothetical protein [Pseudomonas]MBW8356770.1 hypothetical protein [Pseudomonas sp.]MDD1018959.1 hypothetical protein [Pseudomonas idahonensis]MDP9536384.1 hypothetical protein [Pseudomonas protegens]NMY71866.1 hypothetical protein [Pseudomonas sp. WS 5414]PNG38428.1 ribosomal protein S3AE [Pseudomonas protegens]